jgi:tetratricopeptide (TPR) repeat protein
VHRRSSPFPRLTERYILGLLVFEGLLVLLHFTSGQYRLFNLDREYNLPTWFSGIQLAGIGAACVFAFHRERGPFGWRWLWWFFAAGFLYLSFDEIMVIHERALRNEALDALPAASLLRSMPPWQLVFAPVAVIAALVSAFFFARRFAGRPTCWVPGLGGLALWGGAFALEGTATAVFIPRGWYSLEVALEELFEMAGATFLLLSLLRYAGGAGETAGAAEQAPRPRRLAWAPVLALFLLLPAIVIWGVSVEERGRVHRAAGERLLERGDYPGAIKAFSAALDEDPDDLDALKGLGRAAYRAGDLDRAEEAFHRAASLAPEDEVIRNALDLLRVKKKRAGRAPPP